MQRTVMDSNFIQSVSMPNLFPTNFSYSTGHPMEPPGVLRKLRRKIHFNDDYICPHNAVMSLPYISKAECEKDKMKYICIQARLGYVLFRLLGGSKLEEFGYPDKSIIEILNIVLTKTKTKVLEEHEFCSKHCNDFNIGYLDKKQLGSQIIKLRIYVLKSNISKLFRICVPDKEKWTEFGWDGKTVDDILEDLSTGFVANH